MPNPPVMCIGSDEAGELYMGDAFGNLWIRFDCRPICCQILPPRMSWVVYQEDFESGHSDKWEPLDAKQWQIKKTDKGQVYSQHEKKSELQAAAPWPTTWRC